MTFEFLGSSSSVDELFVLLAYDTVSPGIWFLMSYYHTVVLKCWHQTPSDAALYPRRMGTYVCNLSQNLEVLNHTVSTFVFLLQEVRPTIKWYFVVNRIPVISTLMFSSVRVVQIGSFLEFHTMCLPEISVENYLSCSSCGFNCTQE